MAVIFRKKPVQSIAPKEEPDLTERQKGALVSAGLMEQEPERKLKAHIFREGDRVKVGLKDFPVKTRWQYGDTGVVLRTWPPNPEGKAFFKNGGGGVVEVELDNPRSPNHPISMFHDVDLVPA